jgi:hypothetical protein
MPRDVIDVSVGREDRRQVETVRFDGVEKGSEGGAGVHRDRGTALAIGDEIGVRKPPRMRRVRKDHALSPRGRSAPTSDRNTGAAS